MSKPVLYVVINKALNMSVGKVAAQTAHAVAGVFSSSPPLSEDWIDQPHRWAIVLEAQNGLQIWNLRHYLDERDVYSYAVVDEGVNEISPMSVTALAVEVLDKDSDEAQFLSGFKKYTDWRDFVISPSSPEVHHAQRRWFSRLG